MTMRPSGQRRDTSDAQDQASVMAAASPQSASTDADVDDADDADDPFDEIPEAPAADPDEVPPPGDRRPCARSLRSEESGTI